MTSSPRLLNQEALGNPTSNRCAAKKKGANAFLPHSTVLTQVWSRRFGDEPCSTQSSGTAAPAAAPPLLPWHPLPEQTQGSQPLRRGKSHPETPAGTESRVRALPVPSMAQEEQRSRLGRPARPRRGQLPEKPAAAAEVLHFYLFLLYLPWEIKAQPPTPTVFIPRWEPREQTAPPARGHGAAAPLPQLIKPRGPAGHPPVGFCAPWGFVLCPRFPPCLRRSCFILQSLRFLS